MKSKKVPITLYALSQKIEQGFKVLADGIENVKERMGTLEHRMGNVENTLEDIDEKLTSIEHAVDKDAITIINHERRIIRLEKSRA